MNSDNSSRLEKISDTLHMNDNLKTCRYFADADTLETLKNMPSLMKYEGDTTENKHRQIN